MARRVAYMPQAHAGAFAYAVIDVMLMGRAVHVGAFSTPSMAARAVAREALEQLAVSHLAERSYLETSGGERQLVLNGRALAQRAAALEMDEPTASLGFGSQLCCWRALHDSLEPTLPGAPASAGGRRGPATSLRLIRQRLVRRTGEHAAND
jgi:ABC-type cobalamin/Fe3+-siderophores transport system ATPase subunit